MCVACKSVPDNKPPLVTICNPIPLQIYRLFAIGPDSRPSRPGQPDSDVPAGFFPQAKCALGLPKGPPARKAGTWTFTREYEHASVFVDLTNRSAGHVHFTGSC